MIVVADEADRRTVGQGDVDVTFGAPSGWKSLETGPDAGNVDHLPSQVFYKVAGWCQDEVLRIAAIDELNRLNDHYLEDVGINRNDIGSIVGATVKRLRESRKRA